MPSTNDQTLATYDHSVAELVASLPAEMPHAVRKWIDHFLNELPDGARILEIGSAAGRDAGYMEQKGHPVDRTDGSAAFVRYLQEQGHSARQLNILTDDLGSHKGIFANGVLLHLTVDESRLALEKLYKALPFGGVLAISLKCGHGSGIESDVFGPRFFQYWTKWEALYELSKAGFIPTCSSHDNWLYFVAVRS